MPRIIALDYGSKRTGIAVTDPTKTIATALETVSTHLLIEFLRKYFEKESVESIVVGDPRRLNNEASTTTHLTNQFVNRLKKIFPSMPVYRYDERFTSLMATRSLLESGQSKIVRRDKALIDRVSATIILQNYLSSIQPL